MVTATLAAHAFDWLPRADSCSAPPPSNSRQFLKTFQIQPLDGVVNHAHRIRFQIHQPAIYENSAVITNVRSLTRRVTRTFVLFIQHVTKHNKQRGSRCSRVTSSLKRRTAHPDVDPARPNLAGQPATAARQWPAANCSQVTLRALPNFTPPRAVELL